MMMLSEISIQKAKDEWSEIALLHKEYIPEGFLSSLGISFLEKLYRTILSSKESFCYVAKSKDEVIGFVCATRSVRNLYLAFVLKYWWLGFTLISKFSWKFLETLLYPAKGKVDSDIEILSVVVSKEFQGKEVAKLLYQELFNELARGNTEKVSITVGEGLEASNKFQKKMGGEMVGKVQVHKNKPSYIYIFYIRKYV